MDDIQDPQDDQKKDDELDSAIPADIASDAPTEPEEPSDQDLDLIDKEDKKHIDAVPPSVLGEEDPFSGDATSSESPDIDDSLKSMGLHHDDPDETPTPLGAELDDEVE
ncbi:MAG TPA: hypothetical protein VLE91_04240 [Candidatus Saccharimonadales bacterium]|nr:hypothetical protein [Candidatus Saccharimonadales bacterium]